MSELNNLFSQLHEELVKDLLMRVRSGQATAAELNVARQMLKDNGIEAIPVKDSGLEGLTVRATEKLIQAEQQSATAGKSGKSGSDSGKSTSTPRDSAAAIQRIQANLRHKLATSVNVHHGEKKGKIEIEYYGNDDLGRLLDLLGVSAE